MNRKNKPFSNNSTSYLLRERKMRAAKSAWRWIWGSSTSKKVNTIKAEETPVQGENNESTEKNKIDAGEQKNEQSPLPVSTETEKLFENDPFPAYPTYKVVVIGDGGVGKTSYLEMVSVGGSVNNFRKVYHATLGVDVVPVRFSTNKGTIVVNFWDCAGQEKYSGLQKGYYMGAHGFLMVCSMNSVISFRHLPSWLKSVKESSENDNNIAIVATHLDLCLPITSSLPSKLHDIPVFEVSSKKIYPSNKAPVQYLLQKLTGDDSLLLNWK
jgi:GTP-binding nuclear protein Ran